jgi:drug/metabolite transporter (DMT)-like permease
VYLITALVVYSISLVGYAFLLKAFNLNIATLIVVCINVLIVMFVGTIFFKETLNIYQVFGGILCMAGIGLILLK